MKRSLENLSKQQTETQYKMTFNFKNKNFDNKNYLN